jgi:pimeloyl-ACP methyl ester carboxylesterase
MTGWTERIVDVGGAQLTILEAGTGDPVLLLHGELGPAPWQQWHEDLAWRRRLIQPVLPGFATPRLSWIRDARDLAMFMSHAVRMLGMAPLDVIGFSFGGWIAAEMAAANPEQFRHMTLVAPFGIKPSEGFITDMFIGTAADYIVAAFADPANCPEFSALYQDPTPERLEAWEDARRECAQVAWQPYMYDPSLEPLLAGAGGLPSLIVWGDRDRIVPEAAMRAYERALSRSRLAVLKGCGHQPEIERRREFVELIAAAMDGSASVSAFHRLIGG